MRYIVALLCSICFISVAHARVATVPVANGHTITCDVRFCSEFQALVRDFVAHGYNPKLIVCLAHGHTPGSNHDGGGACDFDQRAKNRTNRFMYSKLAESLIRKHGLYSGCSYRDCGHVEGLRGLCNYGQCGTMSARRHRHGQARRTTVQAPKLRSFGID